MVIEASALVFKEWPYLLLAIVVASLIFVFTTWLPNLGLIWQIVASASVPFVDKARILANLTGSIATNFTLFSALSTTVIAVLFGANAAMVAYYVRQRRGSRLPSGQAVAATGLGGLASGLFGVGCAACGAVVLAPILSFFGAAGFVALLPLQGQEFAVFGIFMLGVSIVLVARKLSEPLMCAASALEDGKLGSLQPVPTPTSEIDETRSSARHGL